MYYIHYYYYYRWRPPDRWADKTVNIPPICGVYMPMDIPGPTCYKGKDHVIVMTGTWSAVPHCARCGRQFASPADD